MGNRLSQLEPSAQPSVVQGKTVPLEVCGTRPMDVVPAEYYVEELWKALDKTLENSGCGVGSDLPKDQGGTLDPATHNIYGTSAPEEKRVKEPNLPSGLMPPSPPPLLPDKDTTAVTNSIRALSPRIAAVHGPAGTGKSTVFRLAVAHWTCTAAGVKSGLTVCAQPRRILAQQLCERVKENRKMKSTDKSIGYVIARESLRDESSVRERKPPVYPQNTPNSLSFPSPETQTTVWVFPSPQ